MGAKSDSESGLAESWQGVRFVLIDQSGPRAEFDNWHDAYEFMAASQVPGGSIVRSESPDGGHTAQSGPPSAESARQQPIKKVLIVEDEVFTLLSMTQMVKGAGHDVVIARDADEGFAAIRMDRPDLMVIDVNLSGAGPGWSGFDLIDWLNRHYPRHATKYIVVSGGDANKLKPRSAALGASAFLGKPIVKDELLAEMRRAIGDSPQLPVPAPAV